MKKAKIFSLPASGLGDGTRFSHEPVSNPRSLLESLHNYKLMKVRHLTLPLALLSAATAPAALTIGNIVSVNFSCNNYTGETFATPTGAAVIGASGDTWNDIRGTASNDITNTPKALNLVSGASSGVSISLSTGRFNGSPTDASNLDVYESNIFLDGNGEFGPTGPATITLTGLGAGTFVDLYFYLGAGHTSGQGGTITINGTPLSVTDANGIETAYASGTNYVKFDDVQANGSGEISATWSVASGQRFSAFGGLQIEAVPEPSAALLGSLGLLALLRRRR